VFDWYYGHNLLVSELGCGQSCGGDCVGLALCAGVGVVVVTVCGGYCLGLALCEFDMAVRVGVVVVIV
jgi:hypothetical protein